MKYRLKIRGQDVTLDELESIAAVRPADHFRDVVDHAAIAAHFGQFEVPPLPISSEPVDESRNERAVFQRAGWFFVRPSRSVAKAAESRSLIRGAEAVHRVYESESGLTLGTDLVSLQFNPDVPKRHFESLLAEDHLQLIGPLNFAENAYEARMVDPRPELEVLQELQSRKYYQFIEPEFLEAITGRFTPNDPDFTKQWFHDNNGTSGGKIGADIKSKDAWDLTQGEGTRIAVIDNGMQVDHPDLRAGILRGGYFISNPTGTAAFKPWNPGDPGFPDVPHSTACLAMAGARINNSAGGCGSAPECNLIPIACDYDQLLTQTTLAKSIGYAANPKQLDFNASPSDGAHVISCSLGPTNGSVWQMRSTLDLAIRGAATTGRNGLGIPIFWAATNFNVDISSDQVCSHPDVLAIARSNYFDSHDHTAFGQKLEFLAPGVSVYNAKSGSIYSNHTGCSFAAPLAAGVAALVIARHPDWTAKQIRQRLQDSCDKVGGVVYDANTGKHSKYGFGRINAWKAVQ